MTIDHFPPRTPAQRRERIAELKAAIKRGQEMQQHHVNGLAITEFYIRRCEEEFHALSTLPRRRKVKPQPTAKDHAQLAIKQAAPMLVMKRRGKL